MTEEQERKPQHFTLNVVVDDRDARRVGVAFYAFVNQQMKSYHGRIAKARDLHVFIPIFFILSANFVVNVCEPSGK